MPIARVKTWNDEILFPADLNAEFDNTNASAVPNPFTAAVDGGNQNLTNVAGIGVNQAVVFGNAGANPTVAGQVMRNGTILKYNDGSIVRVNQCLHAVGQSAVIQASAVEEPLYTFTIVAGALGTLNKIQTRILFRVGLLNNASIQIIGYYGGVQGASIAISNLSGSTAGLTYCPLLVTLSADSATDQNLILESQITHNTSNAADAFAATSKNVAQIGPLAIDSAIDQTLQVNVLFSASDAANQCDYLGLTTVLMG